MLKILQVIPDLRKGGAERLVLDICSELNKREQVEVRLLNFREDNEYAYLSKNVKRSVVDARFVPSVTGQPLKVLDGYERFLSEFKPDVIHSHLFEAEIVTRQVLKPGTVYVTHLHDNMKQFRNFGCNTLTSREAMTSLYEKWLMIRQYRKCKNHFIAISKHTAEYFRNVLPTDLQRITVISNAIDYKRFSGRNTEVAIHPPYKLITVGSLVDKKNQAFLVDVVNILMARGYRVSLEILGEGANRQSIQKKIDDYRLRDSVILKGNVERVEDYLQNAFIYVHAATYEPFGLAPLEAMACGLPCVVLDGKGNRDLMEDGKNGFILSRANAEEFASKIALLLDDAKRYRQMSEYAGEYARNFDIVSYVGKLLSFYEGIGAGMRKNLT